MPVSLANLPEAVEGAVEQGIRRGVRREVNSLATPGLAEKIGIATGAAILLIGYGLRRRHQRVERIEAKLDEALYVLESPAGLEP